MKVTKIIHRAKSPNDEGYWIVWAMVYINGDYRYCTLIFDTPEEAKAIYEGKFLNVENTRFSFRNQIN